MKLFLNIFPLFKNSNIFEKNYLFFIIPFLIVYIYVPIIFNAGIIADDWSIYELKSLNYNFGEILKSWFIGSHYSRPIALLIIGSIGFIFGENIWLYHLFNSSLWILSSLIFCFIIYKLINKKIALIFTIFSITPIFSSTNIFSPIEQVQGTFSNFLASLAFINMYFYLQNKKIRRVMFSYFFIILSLLTYETSIVFVPLLILLQNKLSINIFYLIKKNLKKLLFILIPILIMIFLVFFYQSIMKYSLNFFDLLDDKDGVYKYQLFEKGFVAEIIQYSYKPFTLITYDIFVIYFKSLKHIFDNIYKVAFLIVTIFSLLIVLSKKEYITEKNKNIINYFDFYFILFISYGLVILIHVAGTALPTLTGYANRGLCSFSVIYAIFVSVTFGIFFEKLNLNNKFITFIILFLIFLHLNSFVTHRDNYIKSNYIREDILEKLDNFRLKENKNKSLIVFAYLPTFQKNDFNQETIFSSEVHDWPRAIYYKSGQIINSERIFSDKYCKNILNFKNNQYFGKRPSRSRKINKKIEYIFFSKFPRVVKIEKNEDVYLYFYKSESDFQIYKINQENLNKQLKTIFNCI